MFNYYINHIYADLEVLHRYSYKAKAKMLSVDISVFYGKEDNLFSQNESNYWKEDFGGECNIYGFEGGYFYFQSNANKMVDIISEELKD